MPAANAAKPSKLPAHEIIHVITHDIRWKILEALNTDKTAGQISEELGIKPALVLYHLKQLWKVGLVDEFSLPTNKRAFIFSKRPFSASVSIGSNGAMAVLATPKIHA